VAERRPHNLRRTLGDLLLSVCALIVIGSVLIAFDSRVREQVTLRMTSATQASSDVAAAESHAKRLGTMIAVVAKEQVQQHAPMTIFLVVATVLTVFMLRT
jgi:hypothetical protein